ncbi:MAG: nitrilase-related carbon-nitrogen hydrolase, partial [Desulfuromonadaceae bacterium]
MKNMKLALIQQQCGADKEQNLRSTCVQIEQAAQSGANVVVLVELHSGLYFCQHQDTACFNQAETIPGPTTGILARAARDNHVVVVASLFEKRAPGLYHNTAVVFETDGSIAGIYRKMHIPDDPGYNEKFYFTPGDLGFNPIKTSAGMLGVLVCWDQWYPEAARLMTLAGAEVLIYPTAIGWDPDDSEAEQQRQLDAWHTIQRSH